MSNPLNKPTQINPNLDNVLKVGPLTSGPPRYRPPPQPQPAKPQQNYLAVHNENQGPTVSTNHFNHFQAINDVNR